MRAAEPDGRRRSVTNRPGKVERTVTAVRPGQVPLLASKASGDTKAAARHGYVSVEGAARDDGVVVLGDPENDPEGIRVDTDPTAALRGA
ncbi:MAG: hypothetical protein EKK42_03140 [Pseudonocardiaceae bacterium]|nr:MAG: hypothetical protein EKK42_03140 [Pseudonocardiaceae bacterium]